MIDLRRLRVLRAVAHYGTVTHAAEALYMTTSAASQQIRALGRELGVALLEPDGRRVRLSGAAQELLEHADAIEERWQQATAALERLGSGRGGTLRLCGPPTVLTALLTPAAGGLRADDPHLKLQLTEAESAEGVDRVLAESADLAVIEAGPGSPPHTDRRFAQRPLLTDPFDLLVNAGHPLADHPGPVRLADAAHQTWVLEMPENSSFALTLAACAAAGFTPDTTHRARQWNAVATMVGCGFGISLVPRLAHLPDTPPTVRLPLTGPPAPVRQLLTCIRAGSAGHPAIARALDAVHAAADGLHGHLPGGATQP